MEQSTITFHDRPKGKIKVGRITYKGGKPIYPSSEGYTNIVVLSKSSEYGNLSPYLLLDENGNILENTWQFRKFYPWVPEVKQTYSRWDKTVIWKYPQETHIDHNTKEPNDKYWKWRQKGMENKYPVRYPVGKSRHRALCICAIDDNGNRLDYIQARKQIYLKEYTEAVRKEKDFKILRERLYKGENLLIIEVDGPHQESLEYYKNKYGVDDDFITNNTIDVTYKNMIMLNDPKHAFGHGYCLAMVLLSFC